MTSRRVFWKVQGLLTFSFLLVAMVQALMGADLVVWTYAGFAVLGQVGGAAVSDTLLWRIRRQRKSFSVM